MHCGHIKRKALCNLTQGKKINSQYLQTKTLREQKSDVSFKRNATERQKTVASKQHKDLPFLS